MILFWIAVAAIVADYLLEKTRGIDIIPKKYMGFVYLAGVAGLGMWVNPFIHNSAGERTYVQDPIFGREEIIFEPGYHWGGFFARSQSWPDVMNTVFDDDNEVEVQFNDGTRARAQANIRWDLPKDKISMINLHKAYRAPEQLELRTLVPFGKECLGFSAQLMESETHYSGGQSKLKEDFRDQLLNGQYVLETKIDFEMDTITGEQIKTTTADIRVDKSTGKPTRIPSDVQTYNIRCVFAAVPKVTYDSIVYRRLTAKIEQSTKESISKQTLITARQEAMTAVAEGEKLIADVRAEQEALKEKAVIQAKMAKEVAKEEALQAVYIGDKILAEGRANAESNRLKVIAGLTPQEKALLEKEIAIGVAAELAKVQFPSTMIIGGGNGQSAINPFEVLGLESYYNLTKKFSGKQD